MPFLRDADWQHRGSREENTEKNFVEAFLHLHSRFSKSWYNCQGLLFSKEPQQGWVRGNPTGKEQNCPEGDSTSTLHCPCVPVTLLQASGKHPEHLGPPSTVLGGVGVGVQREQGGRKASENGRGGKEHSPMISQRNSRATLQTCLRKSRRTPNVTLC